MKFTTLFSAVALAAAMSTQVFADAPYSDTFETYDLGNARTVMANSGWSFSADSEDTSEIVAGDVTETGFESKSLKLQTNGGLASFAAKTQKDYAATVSMKVKMVASDTMVDVASVGDTTHTALFLYEEGDDDDKTYTLQALSSDTKGQETTTVWVPLTADGFSIANGDVANISIVIDYNEQTATYTVNGTTFEPVLLANLEAWESTRCLNSVAFKGTGWVDDLFVTEEQLGTFATFIYESVKDNETTPISTNLKNIENFSLSSGVDDVFGYNYMVKLCLREDGKADEDLDVLEMVGGEWAIDQDTYEFEEGATYVVKVEYAPETVTINLVDGQNNSIAPTDTSKKFGEAYTFTAPAGATFEVAVIYTNALNELCVVDEIAVDEENPQYVVSLAKLEALTYVIVLDGYQAGSEPTPTVWTADTTIAAGSLVWTAYDAAAGEADFTWTAAAGYAPQPGDTRATLTVLTTTELGGETLPYGTVLLDEDYGTGHVSGLPTEGSALFLIGLDDAEPEQKVE